MRSKLFVPGSRPDLICKAWASDADALSIDLEDAVLEDHKAAARRHAVSFLKSVESTNKTLIVRCNGRHTLHFEADLEALVPCQAISILNIPKVHSPTDVRKSVALLEKIEARSRVGNPLQLLINIETPRALESAAAIAAAHPRIVGLQLGLVDLFVPLGIDRRELANVRLAMFAVRLAAAQAGIFACDSAFPNVADLAGFREECRMARGLGFVGKTCVHPAQVPIANQVFSLTEHEIDHASQLLEAARHAAHLGRGAFMQDGNMIASPALARAESVLRARSEEGS